MYVQTLPRSPTQSQPAGKPRWSALEGIGCVVASAHARICGTVAEYGKFCSARFVVMCFVDCIGIGNYRDVSFALFSMNDLDHDMVAWYVAMLLAARKRHIHHHHGDICHRWIPRDGNLIATSAILYPYFPLQFHV